MEFVLHTPWIADQAMCTIFVTYKGSSDGRCTSFRVVWVFTDLYWPHLGWVSQSLRPFLLLLLPNKYYAVSLQYLYNLTGYLVL